MEQLQGDAGLAALGVDPGAVGGRTLPLAGNLRSALFIVRLAREAGALARVCVASDTPTGTGVMPMGVLKSVCELASLGDLPAETVIALATGNNARAFRLDTGTLAVGRPADLVVCDAPAASMAPDALTAIARGDIPGISAVVIDGEVQVGRSRNTPLAKRLATIAGAVVAYLYFKHVERRRRLEIVHQERLAAMEKAIPLPELPLDPARVPTPSDPREPMLHGLVWTALGGGAMLAMGLAGWKVGDSAIWPLPLPLLLLGLGLLLYYALASDRER